MRIQWIDGSQWIQYIPCIDSVYALSTLHFFATIPGFSLPFLMQQHRADSLLFPPPFLFSPSPFHFKSAGGTKGYTVSRRIPFEPPLIKLKSRKRSLLINLFNRGNRGYRSSKRLFPSFASITTDLHFFSFVSSTSMKRFVHRAHLYSSCTNLVWYTLYITPASY